MWTRVARPCGVIVPRQAARAHASAGSATESTTLRTFSADAEVSAGRIRAILHAQSRAGDVYELQPDTMKALATPDVKERLAHIGAEPYPMSMRSSMRQWTRATRPTTGRWGRRAR